MPRPPSKCPPAYRLHKASGQAVVRIDGRDHYLGVHGSPESQQKYHRLLAERVAAPMKKPAASSREVAELMLTIDDVILAYWRHVESYYVKDGRPTSEQDTIRQALRFVRKLYGSKPAVEFGPLALQAVREKMIDHEIVREVAGSEGGAAGPGVVRVLRKGLCRTFINKQVNRIRRMFAWAASQELIPIGVHAALQSVPGLRQGRSRARERPPVRAVPDEIVGRTIPHLPPVVAAMVAVQRLTGMRPQEVVSLRACDLDRTDPECWAYRPDRHKSEHHGRDRVIFIGPKARAILAPHLEEARGDYLFSPRRAEERRRDEGRSRRASKPTPSQIRRAERVKVSPRSRHGAFYDVASYRRAIRRGCEAAGLEIWTPHQLRYAAATEIRRRFGLEASQAVLGHAELQTTQIYAEVDRSQARRTMIEIG